jgi:hypothetical protein
LPSKPWLARGRKNNVRLEYNKPVGRSFDRKTVIRQLVIFRRQTKKLLQIVFLEGFIANVKKIFFLEGTKSENYLFLLSRLLNRCFSSGRINFDYFSILDLLGETRFCFLCLFIQFYGNKNLFIEHVDWDQ